MKGQRNWGGATPKNVDHFLTSTGVASLIGTPYEGSQRQCDGWWRNSGSSGQATWLPHHQRWGISYGPLGENRGGGIGDPEVYFCAIVSVREKLLGGVLEALTKMTSRSAINVPCAKHRVPENENDCFEIERWIFTSRDPGRVFQRKRQTTVRGREAENDPHFKTGI